MEILQILSIFVAGANFLLGLFVLIVGKVNMKNILFFFLTFVTAGWVFTNWLTYQYTDYHLIELNGRLTYSFSALIIPAFITFLIYFPFKKPKIEKWFLVNIFLAWFIGGGIAIVSAISNLIVLKPIIVRSHLATLDHGKLFPLFFIGFLYFITLSFITLFKRIKSSTGVEKQKIYYLFWGFLVSAFLGTLCNLIFEVVLTDFQLRAEFSLIGPLFTIVMLILVTYAILRYRLMDIRIVIRKSVIQVATFAILFGLYAYALLIVQRTSASTIQLNNDTTLLFVILIIAVTIEPLRRFIYKWIDNLFESKERDRKQVLEQMRMLSSSNLQFENLVSRASAEFSKGIEVSDSHFCLFLKEKGELEGAISLSQNSPVFQQLQSGKLLIQDEVVYRVNAGEENLGVVSEWMKQNNAIALIPVGKNDDFLGAFAIQSEKGHVFTKEKIEFMKDFAAQVQFAFASSLAYKYAIERIKI